MRIEFVWKKRDLRFCDHAPPHAAQVAGAAAAMLVVERDRRRSAEFNAAHLHFTLQGLAEQPREGAARGLPLLVREGEAPVVLLQLHAEWPFHHLLSHEEAGTGESGLPPSGMRRSSRAAREAPEASLQGGLF